MLVLTRKLNQRIVIGSGPNAVTVTVCRVNTDGSVRLGVIAPTEIPVDREEIRFAKENNEHNVIS